jgi:hypothetical protein
VRPGLSDGSGTVLANDGKEIWSTLSGAIWNTVSTGGESIKSLALPTADDPTLDDLGDGVAATMPQVQAARPR